MATRRPAAAPPAVVLAAGAGRRMGGPKALVPWKGEPLVVHAARTFCDAGCPDVVVVLGAGADEAQAALQDLPGVRTVRIPDPAAPMFASILAGIAQTPKADRQGVLVHPVDAPRVSAAAVARLLDAVAEREGTGPDAMIAAHEGRRGHPVWIAPQRIAELSAAPPGYPEGLRGWMRDHAWKSEAFETGDPAVLDDLDTRKELDDVR
jgi:CTP:molybdopterin cytidylyltransferase MocA